MISRACLEAPKQPAGMAGRTATIPEMSLGGIEAVYLSAEFTGYEGMEGTKGAQEKWSP